MKHARQSIWAEGEQNLLRLLEREARYLAAEQVADAALTGLAAQAGILGVRLWDDQHRVLASSPHVSTQALPPADAPSPAAGAPTLTRRGEVLVGAAQLPRLWGTPSHPKRGGWLVVEQNLAPTSTWHSFAAATPCSGCWLLAAGCWLLAAGCWLLPACSPYFCGATLSISWRVRQPVWKIWTSLTGNGGVSGACGAGFATGVVRLGSSH